jgi:crotonobetainyl-CoA:carnitine CoA-transferase CaiB-like acyl-CoA transferase
MRGAGTRHIVLSPFGLFRARDGWVALAADQQRAWERLCEVMDRSDLMADPRFSSPLARQQNRDALYPTIEEFVARQTRAELDAALGGIVPFGLVQDAADIVADPHYAARDMLIEVDRPDGQQPLIVAGVPVKLSRTPGGVHCRAPTLGEHNELLLDVGWGDDQTEELTDND